jgi:Mu-like prophage major head subunit gpT
MSVFNNVAIPSGLRSRHAQVKVWFDDGKSIADADVRSVYEKTKRGNVLDCVMPFTGETAHAEFVIATLGASMGDLSDGAMPVYTPGAASVESKAKPEGFILSVHHTDLRDDRFGIIQASVNRLAMRATNWAYQKIAESLPLGLTKLTIDGKAFFATDHHVNLRNANNGSFSNKLTLALSDDNFADAYASFQDIKFDDGRPDHSNVPDTLIVSSHLSALAEKIVAVPTLFGGAANPNLAKCKIVRVPEWNTLAAGIYKNAWILARTESTLVKPWIWNEREKPRIVYCGSVLGGQGNPAFPLPGMYHQWMVYGESALAFYEPRFALWSAP